MHTVACYPQAVINEDTSGDAAVLRCENQRLKQELALARQLIQHNAAQPGGHAAVEHDEQQAQLQQALTMLAELGDRNGQLEDALDYSKRCCIWTTALVLGVLQLQNWSSLSAALTQLADLASAAVSFSGTFHQVHLISPFPAYEQNQRFPPYAFVQGAC